MGAPGTPRQPPENLTDMPTIPVPPGLMFVAIIEDEELRTLMEHMVRENADQNMVPVITEDHKIALKPIHQALRELIQKINRLKQTLPKVNLAIEEKSQLISEMTTQAEDMNKTIKEQRRRIEMLENSIQSLKSQRKGVQEIQPQQRQGQPPRTLADYTSKPLTASESPPRQGVLADQLLQTSLRGGGYYLHHSPVGEQPPHTNHARGHLQQPGSPKNHYSRRGITRNQTAQPHSGSSLSPRPGQAGGKQPNN